MNQPNCVCCGRFASWSDERATPYGGDEEPLDPWFYCARCVLGCEVEALERGSVPHFWQMAPWMRRVKHKIGAAA